NLVINEATIYSSSQQKGNFYTYTPNDAALSISVIGEPDVVRHISSMPGVSQGVEGTLGLFVRGSNNGSNCILYNGVPIYTPNHLGMFSAFHPETIYESAFYLGGTPVAYSNFSSSLIDIRTKKHYGDSLRAHFSASPYIVGGYLSYPVMKDKISIQVGARTSLLPFIAGKIMEANQDDDERKEMNGQLFDLTTLLDWKINRKNTIGMMFYTTNDFFSYRDGDLRNKLNWNNTACKLEWINKLSSTIKQTTSIYYTTSHSRQEQTTFDLYNLDKQISILRLGTELKEWSVQTELTHAYSEHFSYLLGLQLQGHHYGPLSEKTLTNNDHSTKHKNKFEKQNANLYSAYLELKYSLPDRLMTKLGIRNNIWRSAEKNRWNIDIHWLTDLYVNQQCGMEFTFDRFLQFRHVLEGLPVGWSHNVAFSADSYFPPEITHQYYAGFFWKPATKTQINLSGGLFYRRMSNLVSYINSSNLFGFSNTTWQNEIDKGQGESYGMEASGSLHSRRVVTTMAYTLSKSERKFPQINNGESFPFKFDRRHIVNFQSKYMVKKYTNRKGKKREQYLNGVFSYSTGGRATLPIASYDGVMPPFWDQRESGIVFPSEVDDNAYNRQLMSEINGFRLKDYIRVDLAYTFANYHRRFNTELTISVFNILNRQNPYLYYHSGDEWRQLSIVPIMPSIRWALQF
ncbi:MAG: hypothetical protein LUE93_03615, partial [Bacteroides sp.]|nr:hypothetical protein [Bacteroides sp.]